MILNDGGWYFREGRGRFGGDVRGVYGRGWKEREAVDVEMVYNF